MLRKFIIYQRYVVSTYIARELAFLQKQRWYLLILLCIYLPPTEQVDPNQFFVTSRLDSFI